MQRPFPKHYPSEESLEETEITLPPSSPPPQSMILNSLSIRLFSSVVPFQLDTTPHCGSHPQVTSIWGQSSKWPPPGGHPDRNLAGQVPFPPSLGQ